MTFSISPLTACLLLVVLTLGGPASAGTDPMTKNAAPLDTRKCEFNADFSEVSEVSTWRVLLDGVMGGRSTGVRYPEDKHMTFKGRINTNGGGFSSLRKSMQPGRMKDVDSLKIRLKTDGRTYKLTFRTDVTYRGRPISYQLDIPQTPKGDWSDVTLPLTGFRTSIFGRRISAPPFDPAQVREIGIILADGIDGPFELNLRSLGCR